MMRLDRYLCETGFGTRSQVKALLKKGLVQVDGEIVKKAELKIDEERAQVFCGGAAAVYQKYIYLMMNKPPGVLSATEDRRQKTVLDLVEEPVPDGIFPVGRLDKDTEGLLLLTNDGELAHRLLSPKKHVDKIYEARVEGRVTGEHVRRFEEGLEIGEKRPTLPAVLEILSSGEESRVRITIREGKFHQIKRMFHAVGKEVIYLKRLAIGNLKLDPALALGQTRLLTAEEITKIFE